MLQLLSYLGTEQTNHLSLIALKSNAINVARKQVPHGAPTAPSKSGRASLQSRRGAPRADTKQNSRRRRRCCGHHTPRSTPEWCSRPRTPFRCTAQRRSCHSSPAGSGMCSARRSIRDFHRRCHQRKPLAHRISRSSRRRQTCSRDRMGTRTGCRHRHTDLCSGSSIRIVSVGCAR